jgi:hypothetical protein
MSIVESSPVSDMLVTVKSRELQRAMLAEMAGESPRAARHFLAAAHLELVLASDYNQLRQDDLALRSLFSAASCFWKAVDVEQAREQFRKLAEEHPEQATAIQDAIAELEETR